MATRSLPLTQSRRKALFSYDPHTGEFIRIVSNGRHSRWLPGSVAGSPDKLGYVMVSIDRRKYFAHRLAWLYMTGEWPPRGIDHRDRNPANNTWANLRVATQTQNMQNKGMRSDNTSGIKGVSWSRDKQKWVAQITPPGGKLKCLGRYVEIEEAAAVYRAAATRYFGDFAAIV